MSIQKIIEESEQKFNELQEKLAFSENVRRGINASMSLYDEEKEAYKKYEEQFNLETLEIQKIKLAIKSFLKSSQLAILDEVKRVVEDKKKPLETINEGEYKCPKNCWCIDGEGTCDDCVIFEYNQAIDDILQELTIKEDE